MIPTLTVIAGSAAPACPCSQATGSADVSKRPAVGVGERRPVPPFAPLEELHDRAPAWPAVHAHLVDARAHDRHPAARLCQLGDIAGPAPPTEQPGWPVRGPAPLPPAHRPDPGRVETAAIVEHLQHDPVLADFGQYFVPDPGASVPQ